MSRYRKSMGEIMAEVEKIGQELPEVSPPGWEGSVKAMKKHKDIDNPWALAWHMKNKGDKPHYKDQDGKPEKKAKYKNEEVETGDIVQLDEELPKHLTKFLDKKGNPNKEAQARIDAGRRKREVAARTKDVTPKGYGPNEEDEVAIMSLDHKEAPRKLKLTQQGLEAFKQSRDEAFEGPFSAPGSGSIAKPRKAKAGDENKSIEQQMSDARKESLAFQENEWDTMWKNAAKEKPKMSFKQAIEFVDEVGLDKNEKKNALKNAKKWLK